LLPKQINVGDLIYKTVICDMFSDDDSMEISGEADPFKLEIRINSKIENKDLMKVVFLHELVHTLLDSAGISLKEKYIEALAQALFRFFKHNKMDWFYE
jgi:membrane-bound lytic murein transglycosylase MltF